MTCSDSCYFVLLICSPQRLSLICLFYLEPNSEKISTLNSIYKLLTKIRYTPRWHGCHRLNSCFRDEPSVQHRHLLTLCQQSKRSPTRKYLNISLYVRSYECFFLYKFYKIYRVLLTVVTRYLFFCALIF